MSAVGKVSQALIKHVTLLCVMTAAAADCAAANSERIVTSNGVRLAVREYGSKSDRPILLLAGTNMQLVEWPKELIDGLARQHRRVIVFDHRDAGRSTHFSAAGLPNMTEIVAAIAQGKRPVLAYTANDMANDVSGLMDSLDIRSADLLGVSGGAAIAELLAIAKPDRVRSLVLMGANSGDPTLPMPAAPARFAAIPSPDAHADLISVKVATYKALAGRGARIDEAETRKRAQAAVHRDPDPFGGVRQGVAQLALGDLRSRLAVIKAPTAVLHGADDPLVSVRAGEEVSQAIPGATWTVLPGVGHEIPESAVAPLLKATDAVAPVATKKPL